MRATSPEGEVSYFRTFKDVARELGFNESSIKRAYYTGRNRIADYQLEWLKVDPPKKTYRSIAAKVKEEHSDYLEKTKRDTLVKGRASKLCTYCMRELDREDISDFFVLVRLDNKGKAIESRTYDSIAKAARKKQHCSKDLKGC